MVGTAAMLWVGGSIIIHAIGELGWHGPYDLIHWVAHGIGQGAGFVEWLITAGLDGALGLALGFATLPVVQKGILPLVARLRGQDPAAH